RMRLLSPEKSVRFLKVFVPGLFAGLLLGFVFSRATIPSQGKNSPVADRTSKAAELYFEKASLAHKLAINDSGDSFLPANDKAVEYMQKLLDDAATVYQQTKLEIALATVKTTRRLAERGLAATSREILELAHWHYKNPPDPSPSKNFDELCKLYMILR